VCPPPPPQLGDAQAEWTSSRISGALHKLTLSKLQPDNLYEVEMAAKNCAGLGQPAMMTFRTGRGTAHTHAHTRTHIHTPHAHTRAHTHTHTHTRAFTRAHSHSLV